MAGRRKEEGRKWVLACPECGQLDETGSAWNETYQEFKIYEPRPQNGYVDYEEVDTTTAQLIATEHECGFETDNYIAEDFLIAIEGDKIVDWFKYFDDNPGELEWIAKKHNLTIPKQKQRGKTLV